MAEGAACGAGGQVKHKAELDGVNRVGDKHPGQHVNMETREKTVKIETKSSPREQKLMIHYSGYRVCMVSNLDSTN